MSDKDWKRVIDELDTSDLEVLNALHGVMMDAFENSMELLKLKQDPRLSDDHATALKAVMEAHDIHFELTSIESCAQIEILHDGECELYSTATEHCEAITANDINTEGE